VRFIISRPVWSSRLPCFLSCLRKCTNPVPRNFTCKITLTISGPHHLIGSHKIKSSACSFQWRPSKCSQIGARRIFFCLESGLQKVSFGQSNGASLMDGAWRLGLWQILQVKVWEEMVLDCVWNVMAHAQIPDFVFRRNGRVHLNRPAGASVQSTTGSRGVRISGSNVGYTMFRGRVKSTGYTLHSPVSPSLLFLCVTVCHHISTGVYVPYLLFFWTK